MSGLKGLSSDQLLAQLLDLVNRGRKLEADLIAHLAEVDERRLYLREGCSSMFAYCVEVLLFAEAVAYKRIAAMRAARRHPELLTALRKGELHLTAVSLLAPQLTAKNVTALLAAARHRTADEIRRMLADRQPKPDVVSSVRRLSNSSARGAATPRSGSSVCARGRVDQITAKAEIQKAALENANGLTLSAPAQPVDLSGAVAHSSQSTRLSSAAARSSQSTKLSSAAARSSWLPEPLGDERFLIRFTAGRELYAQIQELKSLMRHQIPDGDVGKILAKAVAVLLKQVRAQKFGECSASRAARYERIVRIESTERAEQTATPSPSRQIPAAIRRAVSKRDGERCTFVSATGRRCSSRDFLEFHHREPWARHRSHAIDGISLRCRAHNQYEAERDFGAKHMRRFRRRDQPQTTELLSEAADLIPEASALFLDTEALLPAPSPSTALQPELDLNPVGAR